MEMQNGIHPGSIDHAVYNIPSETVLYNRDPPPPYTALPTPITTQPQPRERPKLKLRSVHLECPECHQRINTTVIYTNSRKTHMCAGFLFGFTCWCMLCCLAAIPYLLPSFKKAEHYCPNCKRYFGTYSKC